MMRALLALFGGAGLRRAALRQDARGRRDVAFSLWRRLAERGDGDGCFQVASRYESGDGVIQDFAESVVWFRRAAEAGSVEAEAKLGEIYFFGRSTPQALRGLDSVAGAANASGLASLFPAGLNVERDFVQAAHWNGLAAEAGSLDAQIRFADQHLFGLGIPFDESAAGAWYLRAANGGAAAGSFGLGMLCANPGSPWADPEAAVRWLESAAAQGHLGAQRWLALLLWRGRGCEPDEARARRLLEAAAEGGDLEAMHHLGRLLAEGSGQGADLSAAESWLSRAAARGCTPALTALALLFLAHDDPNTAAIHLRSAAERGDVEAQVLLAELCLGGLGGASAVPEAVGWLSAAAAQGSAVALERLGALHAAGDGVSCDGRTASLLIERAVDIGIPSLAGDAQAAPSRGVDEPRAGRARDLAAAAASSPSACLRLAVTSVQDGETSADAAAWALEAADLGAPEGLFILALLQLKGRIADASAQAGSALLVAAAERGFTPAHWRLAELASDDATRSQRWLVEAAQRGDGAAARRLCSDCEAGAPGAVEPQEARGLLEASAHSGDSESQAQLGRWLWTGGRIGEDRDAAAKWLSMAAGADHPFAQAWMGDVLAAQDADAGSAEARKWYWRAARGGHGGALTVLAEAAFDGSAPAEEHPQILRQWETLARRGSAEAQFMSANLRLAGIGGAASAEAAAGWLRKAAVQGDVRSQMLLAALCLEGRVTPTTPSEAVDLLEAAARAGDPEAAYNLGVCFNRGLGRAADPLEARRWFEAAAEQGHASAHLVLGDVRAGEGDAETAVHHYRQAAAAGSQRAAEVLDEIGAAVQST
ncbi:MAG TPA: hypothetical protein VG248_01175 [Caulobacteraceae bacterium]|jgi:hypothetical protein|nr:hypothetical protein [Caulobacteraceae bacterium]